MCLSLTPYQQSAITLQARSFSHHPSVVLLFTHIPSVLIIHPSSPPYFILTSLALRIQSCLRTLGWFKSITLGDRKTLLRCSDWGLLKFISCGIRPEIKKKEKKKLWRAERCIWMFMCVCVRICQVFMKKKGRRVKRARVINAWWSHELSYLFKLSPYFSPLFLSSWYFPPSLPFDNTLCVSSHPTLVHTSPYFSPYLHAHVTHRKVLSVCSYLHFFS